MKNSKRKRRLVSINNQNTEFQHAAESSFQADQNSQNHIQQRLQPKNQQQASTSLHRNTQEDTAGQSMQQKGPKLPKPYQFLKFANPSIHMIFFPHFTIYSLNFALSILLTLMFVILLIYNYTKPQTNLTWNCSLFQLQNKYFPKIRYDYQIWRVIISGFFHSNIAHFCLNMFGLQVYGYFVQWYYGKLKYCIPLILSIIVATFFSAAIQTTSVSTMSSSLLFCIIALKIWFLYQYKDYKGLDNRRGLIYMLMGLIIGINFIPVFVVNNVDYTGHIGGLITGLLFGLFYHLSKIQNQLQSDEQRSEYPKKMKALKWGSLVLLAVMLIACIGVVFSTDNASYKALSDNISQKCSS